MFKENKTIRNRIYSLMLVETSDVGFEKFYNYFITLLIVLNVLFVMLETIDELEAQFHSLFLSVEYFSVFIFSLEYLLRIWSVVESGKKGSPFMVRLKYIFSPLMLIDLFAVLPFYLFGLIPYDFRFLRMFRLIRFFRIFKLWRYSQSLDLIIKIFHRKKSILLTTVYIILFLILLTSFLIYIIEHQAQPDKYTNILESIYWSVITMTSVGYGDMYPVTPVGKILTTIIAMLGVAIFSLPTGIIAAAFMEEVEGEKKKCPHCGKEIN